MTLDRARLAAIADGLAVAVAVSLPWSTSATSILVALWALALAPTLAPRALGAALKTAAGGLPVALFAFGVIGVAWADVPWSARLEGAISFLKLLVIPLLLAQFQGSDRGRAVLVGFLVSATALLAASWLSVLVPGLPWTGKQPGVPVKDYIAQSAVFTLCLFALLDMIIEAWRDGRRRDALLRLALALPFALNIVFVATARTTLVAIAALLVLLGLRRFERRQLALFFAGAAVLAAAAWAASPYLRQRVTNVAAEIDIYRTSGQDTSAGARIDFWTRSVAIMREAPLFGHGTGSIRASFARLAGEDSATNPHNQTFAVGLQLGLAGIAVLIVMWGAHWWLFAAPGLASWIGMAVVSQNIVGSLFNSHLFDFTPGWIYAFGVGVAGGMVLRARAERALAG